MINYLEGIVKFAIFIYMVVYTFSETKVNLIKVYKLVKKNIL